MGGGPGDGLGGRGVPGGAQAPQQGQRHRRAAHPVHAGPRAATQNTSRGQYTPVHVLGAGGSQGKTKIVLIIIPSRIPKWARSCETQFQIAFKINFIFVIYFLFFKRIHAEEKLVGLTKLMVDFEITFSRSSGTLVDAQSKTSSLNEPFLLYWDYYYLRIVDTTNFFFAC